MSLRTQVANRIISATLIGGGIIAAAVSFWPSSPESETAKPVTEQIRAEVPAPKAAPAVPSATPAEPVEELSIAEETKLESARPRVAVEHDDTETDFAAQAEKEVDAGELTKAFTSLRKHIFKKDPTPEILLQIGRIGRQIGETAVAEQALLDAAALDPKNVDTQVELARALLEVGELEDARFHARQAIRLDAENALAWNVAGRIAMAQSNWERAEAALRRAVELEPMNAMIHNNLGLLYIYTRRADDAVDSLETAVELFDESAPYFAFNNLGLAHEMAGHLDEAREAFEQALVVNPTYARAKVNLDRIGTAIAKREAEKAFDTASGPTATDKESDSGT